MAASKALEAQLARHFGERLLHSEVAHDEVTIEVAPDDLISMCVQLRDEAAFGFECLMDVCGVDYAAYGQTEWATEDSSATGFSRGVDRKLFNDTDAAVAGRRYAAVYHLLSLANNHRLRVRVYARDDQFPLLDSVTSVWSSADWYEREAFDLFGIVFDGHPDLRRLLTDYGFIGHPFRKDFPLSGHVEVRYDPDKGRVIYQPVSIEPRVLVPRVIRHDHRYEVQSPQEKSPDA